MKYKAMETFLGWLISFHKYSIKVDLPIAKRLTSGKIVSNLAHLIQK